MVDINTVKRWKSDLSLRGGREMSSWIDEAVIYHIYTLGFCGAEEENQETVPLEHRIQKVTSWSEHLKRMGINTILFAPLFESCSHGYDIIDYYKLDKRLGDNDDLKLVCQKLHEAGFHILLDGVFNHVGRDFFAFKDLQENREESKYRNWFVNVNFEGNSPYNDGFSYEAWEGHYNLVKLNLWDQEVRDYLFGAVKSWIDEFKIDGLRLDVAYCIDESFLAALRQVTNELKPDFWLMGEIIHGDYGRLMKPGLLDSVTNYECYKGIYSSHNDKNYFEINYSLNRLFARGGLYEGRKLYNFIDNHDVARIGSILKEKENLKNVYTMLMTIPGIPSIYYGSEWGIEGEKQKGSDKSLRPELDLEEMLEGDQSLVEHISVLTGLRGEYKALREGGYEQIVVKNQQLIYARSYENQKVYVALNLEGTEAKMSFKDQSGHKYVDVLNNHKEIIFENDEYQIQLQPFSSQILVAEE